MSYTLEKKDIVISGFDKGIADDPYKGISDMRNIEITSVPGEASVGWDVQNTFSRLVVSASATSDAASDIATWAGGATLVAGMAVNITGQSGSGLTDNRAYFILNPTATTFQLSETVGGAVFNLTTGSFNFSVINIAQPKFFVNVLQRDGNGYAYFMIDSNGRAWYYYQQTTWYYMRNLSASGTSETAAGVAAQGTGLVSYKGYLFPFRAQQISYISLLDSAGVVRALSYLTDRTNWTTVWKTVTDVWIGGNAPNNVNHYAIVGHDDTVYFCNTCFVGSFFENPGEVFDPTDADTYTYNSGSLAIPTEDNAISLAELGINLLTGGEKNVIYPWDRVSTSYTYPILLAENYVARMVTVNTNTYIFCGQRGNIYITNGSQASLYKKIPDHLSNTVNPYYVWGDATFNRNQLFFGVKATTNAGVAIDEYGALWGIDLTTDALRVISRLSSATYAGIVSAIGVFQGLPTSDGYGLLIGWFTTIGGIDKQLSTPDNDGEAYLDTDMIPVGTYLNPLTPSQIEWKMAVPLGGNGTVESISIYYRKNITDSYTLLGTTTATGTSVVGTTTGTTVTSGISDYYTANFQKVQWLQLRAVLTSNATTPTYCRLTEIRIREFQK